jgi:hypothetical protein
MTVWVVLYIKGVVARWVSAVQVAYLGRKESTWGSNDLMRAKWSRYVGHSMPLEALEAESSRIKFPGAQ